MFRAAIVATISAIGAEALMTKGQLEALNLNGDHDAYLALKFSEKTPQVQRAFEEAYGKLLSEFDASAYQQHLDAMNRAVSFLEAGGYKTVAAGAHCDYGVPTASVIKGVAAFPGGVVSRMWGADIASMVSKIAEKAGATGASGGLPQLMALQGLQSGAGLIQAAASTLLSVVVPGIPPPSWIAQPMPCMPMLTGHQCFGAVLYPITAADFVIADVTDAQLDGVVAGFPQMYKDRVGRTSDAMYKACYGSYMSMQCGSIFPRCNAPMSRQEPTPVGRSPLCFTACLATLIACPGFWIQDIQEECSTVSAPPVCTVALFTNFASLPPQYQTYEESQPAPVECPVVPASLATTEGAASQFDLYSTASDAILASPYSVAGTAALPNA
eukprot:g20621.t1